MADKKTSDETAASTLTGAELVRGVQSAASIKITIDQIKTYISGDLGAATAKSLALAGAISAASWGLTGVGHTETARTITDTSGAGTVATGATHGLGGNTIAATNARILTNYYSLYVKDSIAGTNVTLTNKWSLGLEGSVNVGGSVHVASAGSIGWSTDLKLWREAANILALQNGTSAQAFNVYNTWSSAGANYERLALKWSSNVAIIGTEAGGTGSSRTLQLLSATNLIQICGTSAAFPALKRNVGNLEVRAADDSGFASLQCAGIIANGDLVVGIANKVRFGGGGGRTDVSSPADGSILFRNNAGTDFDRLQLGGSTSSFPAIKRSGADIQVRLADDSGYAGLQLGSTSAALKVGTHSAIAAETVTGYITIKDSAGTDRKIAVVS